MAKPGKGVPTTGTEKWQHLQEQMDFLRRSCRDFDEGHHSEAKRMANEVVKLVFNKGQFRAVLHQVGLMPGMGFISTAAQGRARIQLGNRLVLAQIRDERVRYCAPTNQIPPSEHRRPRVLPFSDWWNEGVIDIPGSSGIPRWQVARSLRDEQGGGHVDSEVDATMADLRRNKPAGVNWVLNGEQHGRPPDLELHTMRQIAHEVLISIERKLTKG